ncbi:hypothetical protein JOM56_001141 [Amanita muscaria]
MISHRCCKAREFLTSSCSRCSQIAFAQTIGKKPRTELNILKISRHVPTLPGQTCWWRGNTVNFTSDYYIQASLLVCNFATNLYSTCAILYRVLPVAMKSINSARDLYSICQIAAGTSGVLYAATSFALVISIFLQLSYSNNNIMERLCPVLEAVVRYTYCVIYTRCQDVPGGHHI